MPIVYFTIFKFIMIGELEKNLKSFKMLIKAYIFVGLK